MGNIGKIYFLSGPVDPFISLIFLVVHIYMYIYMHMLL